MPPDTQGAEDAVGSDALSFHAREHAPTARCGGKHGAGLRHGAASVYEVVLEEHIEELAYA